MNVATALTDRPDFQHLQTVPYQQALTAFYQAAVLNALPVALWRTPDDSAQQALLDFSGQPHHTRIDFQHRQAGFAFAPFVNDDGRDTLFIRAGLHLRPGRADFYPLEQTGTIPAETINRSHFLATYRQLVDHPVDPVWLRNALPVSCPHCPPYSQTEYCRLVAEAVQYIKESGIKKVVTSRTSEIPLPGDFSPVAAFDSLCRRYQHAFVSLVSIPNVGTWIGATPEMLLYLEPGTLKTVALAGTQAHRPELPLEAVTWGAKEIEEQALVADYIRAFFHRLGVSGLQESGPRTASAGNILHLLTEFQVSQPDNELTQLANQVLHELHPTSAVCGMPKLKALDFILQKEKHGRAFYSGFLGPIHLAGRSDLFVNLRCMQLTSDSAVLYIGGGITQDSIPQAEWRETVWKAKTLLPVLEEGTPTARTLAPIT